MRHSLTRLLPYQPGQLFELVGDVERYPQFVRWVSARSIKETFSPPTDYRYPFMAEE